MKKIFFLLVALATLGSANANVIFHEAFVKEAGKDLQYGDFQNIGNDQSNWYYFLPASGKNTNIQVAEGSLSYEGYVSEGKGNKAEMVGNGDKVLRQFNAITSGKVYVAAIINVDSLKSATTADYFFTLGDVSASNMYARLYTRSIKTSDEWTGFNLGIAKNDENSTARGWAEETYAPKTNYLIVIEYEFVEGEKNDTVRLYVNPTKATTQCTAQCVQDFLGGYNNTQQGASGKADATKIASVNLRESTATPGRIYIDEIKVATAWEDLFEDGGDTPEPQPVAAIKTSDKISFGGMVYTGETYTASLQVTGENLTDDITITCDNEEITFSTTTITKEAAMSEEGATVEVTLTPAKADAGSATITLTSGEAKATTTSNWWTVAITNYATLAEVKAAVEAAGEDGEVCIRYTGEAIITYIADNAGDISFYYIQDATAGMQIGAAYVWKGAKVGDKISNFAAGNGAVTWNFDYPLTPLNSNVTILSSDNSVAPQVVTLAELKANANDYLYELVKVEDVTLDVATSEFASGSTKMTQDGAEAFINLWAGNELIGEKKPSKADITGVSSSTAGNVIRPRGKADIVDKTSGSAIENVAAEAESEIYTVSGMRVSELQPGVNIIRKGEKTYKVIR